MSRRSATHKDGRRLDAEARIALVQLSGMGPARTRWLLSEHEPREVVARLRSGRFPIPEGVAPPGLQKNHLSRWASDLAKLDSGALYQTQVDKGWTILVPDDPRWPFSDEPEPPLLLFCEGDADLLAHTPAVAIVGTRRCTSVGRAVAYQLGADLASSDVAVLSGLALGVDAAAHHGALDIGGAAVGVVGTGLDVIYPKRNRTLWADMSQAGLLISEYPAGMKPDRWRFPARNRIIAALSDGVVVVESHARGGSLLTADEAADRDRPVMAVPGAVVNPAADGTNGLIIDGAIPVRNGFDVLGAIGHHPPSSPANQQQLDIDAPSTGEHEDEPISLVDLIRREVGSGSVSMDRLVVVSGRTPVEVVQAVDLLQQQEEVWVDGTTVTWSSGPQGP